MLLAIASKLVTANLVTRSKRIYAKLDVTRREIAARLKEVQLKRTSARGTLEFWERRRTETSQKVQDATRDLENYGAQFEDGDDPDEDLLDEGGSEELMEPAMEDQEGVADSAESDHGEVADEDLEAANADEADAEVDEEDPAEGQLPQSK